MSLPPEIRNEVYALVLAEHTTIHIRARPRKHFDEVAFLHLAGESIRPWREPSLLHANRAIRSEASAMYYKVNVFEISLLLSEAHHAVDWLRSIVSRCGTDPFRHFNFYVRKCQWEHFRHVYSIAALFKDFDLVLRPEPVSVDDIGARPGPYQRSRGRGEAECRQRYADSLFELRTQVRSYLEKLSKQLWNWDKRHGGSAGSKNGLRRSAWSGWRARWQNGMRSPCLKRSPGNASRKGESGDNDFNKVRFEAFCSMIRRPTRTPTTPIPDR